MIVPFDESYVSKVVETEKACFAVPWSESSVRMLLNEPWKAFVCLRDGEFAAYCGIMLVLDELSIMNIATLPSFRRKGCAKELLSSVYAYAKENNATLITLEVRESNTAARSLYASEGFCETYKRPSYYTNPPEAAIIMEKKL